MAGLRDMWGEVIPDAGDLADTLVRRYTGQRTAYRDKYLIAVLDALDSLEQLATDPVAVRLAAWFHRAAHSADNTATDDAAASAQLAEDLLPAYGVNEVRTAEVARLVRQGGQGGQDANGEVLQDAINAVLADPQYSRFASEVRRDSRFDDAVRREQIRGLLAAERIYRTDLAHERYEQAARANLTTELELLDGMNPSAWRGWQHTGLALLAVLTALVGLVAGAASIAQPWQIPAPDGDPKWQAILMAVLAAASVAALWWAVLRTDDLKTRIAIAGPAVIGLVGAVVVPFKVPPSTGTSGAGQRVPLLMITFVLLFLASAAAFAAVRSTPGIRRNRGQVLAGLGAVAVVVLATLLVIDPIQRAYLLRANEYLDNKHQPADLDVASVVDGGILWTSPGGRYGVTSVATAHGIAYTPDRGTVTMLDPKTGTTRWRYIRSDTEEPAKVYPLDGGQRLLVSFDGVGYVVLDTDTGKRTAAWADGARDDDVDDSDPLVTARTVSKGSDKVYGTNADGSHRWTYEPGRCTGTSAVATADTAVLAVGQSCEGPAQMIGLDLKSGKKLWSQNSALSDLTVAGDLVVGLRYQLAASIGQMIALDARSGAVRWSVDLPNEWGCPLRLAAAGKRLVLLTCPTRPTVDNYAAVHFVDPGNGHVVSTANVAVPVRTQFAVTADGRVFMMGLEGARCRILQLADGAAPKSVVMDRSVECGWGALTAGNLVLVRSEDSLIALR